MSDVPEGERKFYGKYADKIKKLVLMDDWFMSVVFDGNAEPATLLVRIILGKDDITVTDVMTQKEYRSSVRKGKSVKLDIIASDSSGRRYDIEVQRCDRDAVPRRARYYSSMLDMSMLKSGESYEALADSYVIFITDHDVIGRDRPIYHIDRTIEEACGAEGDGGRNFNDGSHIIYVNGEKADEGNALGRLMHDFHEADLGEMYYSEIAQKVRDVKEKNAGGENMLNILDQIETEAREQGRTIGLINGAIDAFREVGMPEDKILVRITQKFNLTKEKASEYMAQKNITA